MTMCASVSPPPLNTAIETLPKPDQQRQRRPGAAVVERSARSEAMPSRHSGTPSVATRLTPVAIAQRTRLRVVHRRRAEAGFRGRAGHAPPPRRNRAVPAHVRGPARRDAKARDGRSALQQVEHRHRASPRRRSRKWRGDRRVAEGTRPGTRAAMAPDSSSARGGCGVFPWAAGALCCGTSRGASSMSPDDHAFAPVGSGAQDARSPASPSCPRSARTTAPAPARWTSSGWTPSASAGCAARCATTTPPGVICEKVARYAERIHHPDRLMKPLRRIGPKGSRQFAEISWADALDIVAEQFIAKARQHGSETVWPYYYAGTMGLVQRDGINRLRHAMKYSRWFSTICVTLSDTGWIAGVGRQARRRRARGRRAFGPGGDLGRQSGEHPGQRHDPRHARQEARRQAGRGRSLPHRHGRAGRRPSRGASRHRRRAGGRRHACPVQGGLCRLGLSAQIHRRAGRACRARRDAHAGMGVEDHRPVGRGDRLLRAAVRPGQGRLHPLPSRLQPQPQRRAQHARRHLPAGGDRRVEGQGRRRALRPYRHVPDQQDADRGPRHDRPLDPRARPVAARADPDRRRRGAEERPAGDRRC